MGFNLGTLTIDEDVSKTGVWVDYLQGSRVKIASSSSHVYKGHIARLYKSNRLQLDDTNPDNFRKIQELTAQAMAEKVLLDWDGMDWQNEDGSIVHNVPYSPKLGKEVLLKADAFREFVSEKAGTAGLFKKEIIEEAVGN
jgi:hypothetical protein